MKIKKLSLLLATVLTVSVIFVGCEKEELVTKNQINKDNEIIISQAELPQLSVTNGILTFDSDADFKVVYNYFSKSTLEIEKYLSNYKFSSLMNKYLDEEEIWLNNYELDFSNDPDNKYIDDDVYRNLLNENGELIISGVIYKFAKDNVVYKIHNMNWNSLEKIRLSPNSFEKFTDVKDVILINYSPDKSYSCKQNFHESGSVNYQTDKLVKWEADVTNVPFTASVKATTTSYQRKGLRWIKYDTSVKARIYDYTIYELYLNGEVQCASTSGIGSFRSGDIDQSTNDDKAVIRLGNNAVPFTVRDNTIKMYYYCNGWSKTYTLNW